MTTIESITPCHECEGTMIRAVRPRTLTYKGQSETVEMPGWYCENCSESIHSGADMDVSDRAIRRLKAKAENLLLPEQVRAVRKKLGLTQKRAGEIIGGGANAFFKYERGEIVPSQAVSNLLRVLDADPAGLNTLMPKEDRQRPQSSAPGSGIIHV